MWAWVSAWVWVWVEGTRFPYSDLNVVLSRLSFVLYFSLFFFFCLRFFCVFLPLSLYTSAIYPSVSPVSPCTILINEMNIIHVFMLSIYDSYDDETNLFFLYFQVSVPAFLFPLKALQIVSFFKLLISCQGQRSADYRGSRVS